MHIKDIDASKTKAAAMARNTYGKETVWEKKDRNRYDRKKHKRDTRDLLGEAGM